MKLLGRNIDGKRLLEEVRARLTSRGIQEDQMDAPLADEAPVEPFAYLVQALEGNVDPVEPTTARKLREQPVRGLLRFAMRGVLVQVLSRQHAFNTQVYQLAAQLSAEVLTLRSRLAELEGRAERSISKTGAESRGKSAGPTKRRRNPGPRRR